MTPGHADRLDLAASAPPAALSPALKALWWDAKGDWEQAHGIIADETGQGPAWVHAYLHRKEGDDGNAGYWYRRAGKPICSGSLRDEWASLVTSLLDG